MHRKIIEFSKHKSMDAIPGIESLRTANASTQYLDIMSATATTATGGDFIASGTDNTPYRMAHYYISDFDGYPMENAITKRCPSLLDITDLYFDNLSSNLTERPFELFATDNMRRRHGITDPERVFELYCGQVPYFRELMLDTYNFIVTGRRDINIDILYSMAKQFAADNRGYGLCPSIPVLNVKQRFKWDDLKDLSSQEFFLKWTGQKYGLQDLICSYKVMLGV